MFFILIFLHTFSKIGIYNLLYILSHSLQVNYICISCFVKNGIHHQLRVSGINRTMYWLSYLIGDLLMCILSLIVLFILVAAMNIKSLNMSALFLVLVAFILHVLGNDLFCYTISLTTKKSMRCTLHILMIYVSLFCNIITWNIVSYLVLESWVNPYFDSLNCFTVSFTARVMSFFLSFLLDVLSELTAWNVSNFRDLFLIFKTIAAVTIFLETNTT